MSVEKMMKKRRFISFFFCFKIREAFRRTCEELQQTQKIVTEYKQVRFLLLSQVLQFTSFFFSFQICSQLNGRLDRRKEKYKTKIEFLQSHCCDKCRSVIETNLSPNSSLASTPERELSRDEDVDDDLPSISSAIPSAVTDRLRQVEIELAEKKLALTQALCENQELIHQLRHSTSIASDSDTNSVTSQRSTLTNNSTVSWLSKTVNTIKEAATSTNRAKVN